MNIDSINNGIVIDHIRAGGAMEIFRLLGLDLLDCPIAIIKNAPSHKLGRKDIIKIDSIMDINLDVLGYVDPNATINIIRDGELTVKKHVGLPERIESVLHCKNPRCITSTEPELPQIFKLANHDTITYRCIYCEAKAQE